MKNKIIILTIIAILILGIIGVSSYFIIGILTESNNCFKGDFKCEGNTAKTCSIDGKWTDEVCRSPNICGGGGVSGCGNPNSEGGSQGLFCGDEICSSIKNEDKYSCPLDCGLPLPVCGDGVCNVFQYSPNLPPYSSDTIDEFDVCPQDCGGGIQTPSIEQGNAEIIYSLTQKQRPLVGGLQIEMKRNSGIAYCSLGAIVKYNGKNYVLTASHCVSNSETSGAPSESDIGLPVKQGKEQIGSVYKTADYTGCIDSALISINNGISSKQEDFLGNSVIEFGTATKGLKVYKIGRTTGLTYGTISGFVGFTGTDGDKCNGFEVKGDNGNFCEGGDSGSAIISVDDNKIIGIISSGSDFCNSNMPEDIKSGLGI